MEFLPHRGDGSVLGEARHLKYFWGWSERINTKGEGKRRKEELIRKERRKEE
jgi:hypothetical protein